MSETIQQIKQLTFEEICPRWAWYYRRLIEIGAARKWSDKSEEQKKIEAELKVRCMDLTDCDRCVVGEAHGWTQDYHGCAVCHNFAMHEVFDYSNSALDRFVQHWNTEHRK